MVSDSTELAEVSSNQRPTVYKTVRGPSRSSPKSPNKTAEIGLDIDARIFGAIDRLIVEPDRVLAIDYKTNAHIPDTAAQVPTGILRQMGAYHAALSQIYPEKTVDTAILWTSGPVLMPLPSQLIAVSLGQGATS